MDLGRWSHGQWDRTGASVARRALLSLTRWGGAPALTPRLRRRTRRARRTTPTPGLRRSRRRRRTTRPRASAAAPPGPTTSPEHRRSAAPLGVPPRADGRRHPLDNRHGIALAGASG